MKLLTLADRLVEELRPLRFQEPVSHIYNPLEYARSSYRQYIKRFGVGRREVLLVGMNPGPWGMAQTGVPFGEVSMVRDWMGISTRVDRPVREHPKRPIEGFACKRSEVSGRRLWGWARASFGEPERFFARYFVANYCPLVFMEESGRNATPDKLPAATRKRLNAICDRALEETIAYLKPKWVIGIGQFAERRISEVVCDSKITVGRILHPSPASPAANQDWAGKVTRQLRAIGAPTR